jgi:hypothetical protein
MNHAVFGIYKGACIAARSRFASDFRSHLLQEVHHHLPHSAQRRKKPKEQIIPRRQTPVPNGDCTLLFLFFVRKPRGKE